MEQQSAGSNRQTSRLTEVTEDWQQPTQPSPTQNAGLQLLLLALKALSQRFVVALYGLRDVILAGSVFWAAMTILPKPDTLQLVGLGLYAAFILTLISLIQRRT